MEEIIIGFSKPKNNKFPIFSWLIRLIEWTPYSHVYIQWHSDSLERDIIYQASGTMVNFMGSKRFNEHVETLFQYKIKCSSEAKKRVVQKAIDLAGAPYGVKQVFGITLVKLMRFFGKDIVNPFADGSKTWVCSELGMEIITDLGLSVPVQQENATPRDIKLALDSTLH